MSSRHLGIIALALAALTACQANVPAPNASLPAAVPQAQAARGMPSGAHAPQGMAPTATAPVVATTAPAGVVSPELVAALRQLTDDDFKTRQQAVAHLQEMMTRQFQQMVTIQQLMLQIQDGLSAQLRLMTQNTDPESEARIAGLFEFNAALSRWAIDVLALPREQADRILAWGLDEKRLPLIARAYHRKDEIRAQAARELGQIPGPEADWMLLQLLNSPSREVSLMAMDAVYDRPPTAAATRVLWERSIVSLRPYDNRFSARSRIVTVRGRSIDIYEDVNANRSQDADVAVDVLIHQKDPLMLELLNKFFIDLASAVSNPNDGRWRALSPNYGSDAGRAISRLIEAFHPPKAIPFFVKAITVNGQDGSDTTMNNEKMRYSSRIDFAAMLILAVGQDPEDYNLKKYANWGNRWLLKGAQPEEDAMVKKLQDWWKQHAADYGETVPVHSSTR